jgi:hypothetical protein
MDYILIAIIIAGLGLSGAYLRAELLLHRRMTALQRTRKLEQRKLHSKTVSLGQNDMCTQPVPAPTQTMVFQVLRVLARALCMYIQERKIHRFWIRA